MRWQDKLTKAELKHLREMGITTLTQARSNAQAQVQMMKSGVTMTYEDGTPKHPCFECSVINPKLGLPRWPWSWTQETDN